MNDKEIQRGFYLIIENADSLIKESELLLKNNFFARSYTLAQLAIEEVGKCSIICNSILRYYQGEDINAKFLKEWGFLDHRRKTKESLKSELIAIWMFEQSIGEKTNLKESIIKDFQEIDNINDLKNNSLYVGVQNDAFITPLSTISKEMAEAILYKAKLRWAAEKPLFRSLTVMKESAEAIMKLEEDPKRKQEIIDRMANEIGVEF